MMSSEPDPGPGHQSDPTTRQETQPKRAEACPTAVGSNDNGSEETRHYGGMRRWERLKLMRLAKTDTPARAVPTGIRL